MKLTIFLIVTLFTGVLAAPLSKTVIVRDETLVARRLPDYATPRIGVTATSSSKAPKSHIKRSISRKGLSLVSLVDRVAGKIKTKCDDIGTNNIPTVTFPLLTDDHRRCYRGNEGRQIVERRGCA